VEAFCVVGQSALLETRGSAILRRLFDLFSLQ
jgi:hypothetical protein